MISQMATLTLAGHETTANTMSWMLWELSKLPEYQEKMRAEIAVYRAKLAERGAADFSIEDLESMPCVNAALKVCPGWRLMMCDAHYLVQESLRYHPAVYHISRVAEQDDVIPLALPIHSKSGEVINEIPVSKGTPVLIDICAYNRCVVSRTHLLQG